VVVLVAVLISGAITLMSPRPAQAWVGDCRSFIDYRHSAGTAYCDGGPPTIYRIWLHCKVFGFIDDHAVGPWRDAGSGEPSSTSCIGTLVDHRVIVILEDQA
jgi:hypothetical protein